MGELATSLYAADNNGLEHPTRGQSLTFESISFSYSEDREIVHNVSFTAEAGQMTAFVGPSGAGKTTVFSLIERFYDSTDGEIVYGSTPIRSIPLQEWRRRIAYVSQESPIMEGTIKANLTYGLESYSEVEINDALRQANLDSFIATLPEGCDTEVGERGVKLSGGQRHD